MEKIILNTQKKRELKSCLLSIDEEKLKKLLFFFQAYARMSLEKHINMISYKCIEAKIKFASKAFGGYGKTENEALMNSWKNFLDYLLEDDNYCKLLLKALAKTLNGGASEESSSKECKKTLDFSQTTKLNINIADESPFDKGDVEPLKKEPCNLQKSDDSSSKTNLKNQRKSSSPSPISSPLLKSTKTKSNDSVLGKDSSNFKLNQQSKARAISPIKENVGYFLPERSGTNFNKDTTPKKMENSESKILNVSQNGEKKERRKFLQNPDCKHEEEFSKTIIYLKFLEDKLDKILVENQKLKEELSNAEKEELSNKCTNGVNKDRSATRDDSSETGNKQLSNISNYQVKPNSNKPANLEDFEIIYNPRAKQVVANEIKTTQKPQIKQCGNASFDLSTNGRGSKAKLSKPDTSFTQIDSSNKENPNVSLDDKKSDHSPSSKKARKTVPKLPLDILKPKREEKSLNNYYLQLFQKNHNIVYVAQSTEEDMDV